MCSPEKHQRQLSRSSSDGCVSSSNEERRRRRAEAEDASSTPAIIQDGSSADETAAVPATPSSPASEAAAAAVAVPAVSAGAHAYPSSDNDNDEEKSKSKKKKKSVAFSDVTVRHYPFTLGTVNPYASLSLSSSSSSRHVGVPLTLSWKYSQLPSQSLRSYESSLGYDSLSGKDDKPRKSTRQMRMSARRRRTILLEYCRRNDDEDFTAFTPGDVEEAERAARKCDERRRRYLAWCRGEERAGLGTSQRASSERISVRQRPSYPPLDADKDDTSGGGASFSGRCSPRKANDECIALLRQRALASVAASRMRQRGQPPPSSNDGDGSRAGGAPQTGAAAAKRRVFSSRAA